MQIRTATASVENGGTTVTASAGNDWSAASVGDLFSIQGADATLYMVAAVRSPGENVSARWELSLTAPYAGATATGVAYQITKDFTPLLGLPLPDRGDVEIALLLKRAFLRLDSITAPWNPAGEWDEDQEFQLYDLVSHAGGTWLAMVPNTGVEPEEGSAVWQPVVMPNSPYIPRIRVSNVDYSILTTEHGTLFTNYSATGGITFTLPNADDFLGFEATFAVEAAHDLFVDSGGTNFRDFTDGPGSEYRASTLGAVLHVRRALGFWVVLNNRGFVNV